MVRVGFIVEGSSDLIILKSEYFKKLYLRFNLDVQDDFFRIAKGKPNIKIDLIDFVNSLRKKEVEVIFLLVDQDSDKCLLETKNDILTYGSNKNYTFNNIIFVVMTRELEAWFLSDDKLGFNINQNIENILKPSVVVGKKYNTTSHIKIANRIRKTFSLERASENSISAKRFLEKLKNVAPVNKITLQND